eukprot:CAMPEP_0117457060 /NCGR_PEP_ID=MMETSP0784-20121206/190_1 /TAXON_ID=39447 /ORGANISM="" /LENGTH=169 /DNA_ID=CAMNT_0005250475 /DNA_START=184 /DNA_END=695 /DNA_ORIENTATION=-
MTSDSRRKFRTCVSASRIKRPPTPHRRATCSTAKLDMYATCRHGSPDAEHLACAFSDKGKSSKRIVSIPTQPTTKPPTSRRRAAAHASRSRGHNAWQSPRRLLAHVTVSSPLGQGGAVWPTHRSSDEEAFYRDVGNFLQLLLAMACVSKWQDREAAMQLQPRADVGLLI